MLVIGYRYFMEVCCVVNSDSGSNVVNLVQKF